MATLLMIWFGMCAVMMVIGSRSRYPSAGLPLAYFIGLSIIHTPGAALYIEGEMDQAAGVWTLIGFQQTVIGMAAFSIAVMAARFSSFSSRPERQPCMLGASALTALDRLALLYFLIGLFCFLAGQALSGIPSVTSIVSGLGSLMIVGASLRLWVARELGDRSKWWQTIALLPVLPLLTMVKDGFLGFGTYWMLAIACFLFNQSKRARVGYFLLAPLVAFVALSVFVNWTAAKPEFRQRVWYQQVGIGDRIHFLADILDRFEWIDYSNPKQRNLIDLRLNQNYLVGLAVDRLESEQVAYGHGATLATLLIGLIPRALWPDKPAVGGGGVVVTYYTGMPFPEGTSVGAGQVLEFYINFGTLGVIGGFLLYGWVIGRLDVLVGDCLDRGDQKGFLLWFIICLSMLQPGGNLLEVVVNMAGSVIGVIGLSHLLNRRFASLAGGVAGETKLGTT